MLYYCGEWSMKFARFKLLSPLRSAVIIKLFVDLFMPLSSRSSTKQVFGVPYKVSL